MLEALQLENDPYVVWSILISLKPRVSGNNLDQVLNILDWIDHLTYVMPYQGQVHLIYLIYLIAATVKPQLYAAELIRKIPDIHNSQYIQEVESTLRGLSDDEFIQLASSLRDWADTFQKATLLIYFGGIRGDEFQNRIQSILFPDRLEESSSGKPATPMMDWVVNSLFQRSPLSPKQLDQERKEINRRRKTATWLQRVLADKTYPRK